MVETFVFMCILLKIDKSLDQYLEPDRLMGNYQLLAKIAPIGN